MKTAGRALVAGAYPFARRRVSSRDPELLEAVVEQGFGAYIGNPSPRSDKFRFP